MERCGSEKSKKPYTKEERYESSTEYKAGLVVMMLGTNDTTEEKLDGYRYVSERLSIPDQRLSGFKEQSGNLAGHAADDTV